VLKLAIELIGLKLELLDLVLLRSDVPFQVLDLVVEDKFEFFKLLGLFLKFEDFPLTIRD